MEQNREIIDRFLEKHLKGHYYAWAIHEKVGAMSVGERHPHVHIMFSTREMDAVERTQERTPELFFRRANKKVPACGGCPKAEKWVGRERRDYLLTMREDYARIQNEVLEKYHIPARVSHLGLEAQKMQAEMRGDWVLAEILDRFAETPTSPISIVRDDDIVRRQKQLRKFNDKRRDRIMRRALKSDATESPCMSASKNSHTHTKKPQRNCSRILKSLVHAAHRRISNTVLTIIYSKTNSQRHAI